MFNKYLYSFYYVPMKSIKSLVVSILMMTFGNKQMSDASGFC